MSLMGDVDLLACGTCNQAAKRPDAGGDLSDLSRLVLLAGRVS